MSDDSEFQVSEVVTKNACCMNSVRVLAADSSGVYTSYLLVYILYISLAASVFTYLYLHLHVNETEI